MDKNKDEILSFDELRKELGIDEKKGTKEKNQKKSLKKDDASFNNDNKSDIIDEIDKKIDEQIPVKKDNTVVSNGHTFVDITDQYVNKKSENIEQPTIKVEEKQTKKVRTFNEIFASFFGKFLPKKKDSGREKARKIIMDLSIIVIVGCLIGFGELYRQRRVEIKLEDDLKNQIINDLDENSGEYFDKWQDVIANKPDNIEFPEGMNLKYSYLYMLNPDLVGWLRIKNTNLDVQVVQSKDNDFYHRRNFYKKSSRYGCPYMDCRNDAKFLNDNNVIYGHHMPDGLMFSNLDRYKTVDGYKEAPVIQFDTLYETYYFKIFAAFITNADKEADNGNLFNYTVTSFPTDEKFNGFIAEARKRSILNTSVTVEPDDKILTLATCTYDFSNARFVVMARMLRPNESVDTDVNQVELNTSPKYPQAWYDAKGLTNPYKDDKTWTLK